MERKVLGKGMAALIPEREKMPLAKGETIVNLEISKIAASKYQPRELFRKERLNELVASIKEKGVVQPVLVRETPDGTYELIAGERRLRAVKELGFGSVPAIIKNVSSDADLLELSLIENIQRENLNSIEEAHAYQRLIDEFKSGLEAIGKAVGKDKSSISNILRLLKLPKKVQDYITADHITTGHGKALLSIDNPKEQLKICEKVIKKGLSVRETELLVNKRLTGKKRKEVPRDQDTASLEDELQRIFGTRVKILHTKQRGRIQIEYFSLDDMERILKLLRKCI